MTGAGHWARAACPPLAAAALLVLSACSHGDGGKRARGLPTPPPTPTQSDPAPTPPPVTPARPTPTPGLSPQQRTTLGFQLLQQGRTAEARVELGQALADRPNDRVATTLVRSIDTDPRVLLGADSFAYSVRAGDTLFSLARTFLKDGMNFYALARYNGLTLPSELGPGQTLLIPGRPRAPDRAPPPPRRQPSAAEAPSNSTAPTAPVATPAQPVRREEAQRLRAQGLAQMSAGSIDRAVTLLSQAASLDPESRAIAGDLARARRIQATVRSR